MEKVSQAVSCLSTCAELTQGWKGVFNGTVQEEMSILMNVRPKLFVLHNKSKERVVGFLLGKERNMKY